MCSASDTPLSVLLPLCSVDNLRGFVRQFLDGEIEAYIKSEPIPEDNTGPVKVSTTGSAGHMLCSVLCVGCG